MEITVAYTHSVKDAKQALHVYRSEVRDTLDTEGLAPEQKITKFRSIAYFYHNELHRAIQKQQEADGIPPELRAGHVDAKPPELKVKKK